MGVLWQRHLAAFGVLAALGLLLAACGGSQSASSSGTAIKVTMTDFKFDPSTIQTKAGSVDFELVNSGSVAHDMVVVDSSGKVVARSALVQPKNSADFAIPNLAAGNYDFYCDVPGHKEAGMVGKLQVS